MLKYEYTLELENRDVFIKNYIKGKEFTCSYNFSYEIYNSLMSIIIVNNIKHLVLNDIMFKRIIVSNIESYIARMFIKTNTPKFRKILCKKIKNEFNLEDTVHNAFTQTFLKICFNYFYGRRLLKRIC